jgi:hypothetical protein
MVAIRVRRLFLVGSLVLLLVLTADVAFSRDLVTRQSLASLLPLLPVPPGEGDASSAPSVMRAAQVEELLRGGQVGMLELTVPNGSVHVEPAGEGGPEVSVTARARALTREDADQYVSRVNTQVQQVDDCVQVTLDAPLAPTEVSELVADWTVRVPPGIGVSLHVTGGSVYVGGVQGDVSLTSFLSPQVTVEDVLGDATVMLTRSPGVVRNIAGDLHITSGFGDVQVEDVRGTVRARVIDFANTSIFRADEVIITDAMGFGELRLGEVKTVDVEMVHGTVAVLVSDLEAGLEYDLRARTITGDVPLDIRRDEIHQRAQGRIGRGETKVRVHSVMGEVRVFMSQGD